MLKLKKKRSILSPNLINLSSAKALKSNSRGQTLIEVLIALAILGIVVVAFMTALTTSSRAIIVADEHTTAESLARSELEYVKSQDYHSAPWFYTVTTAGSTGPVWLDTGHHLPAEYANYSLNVSASCLPSHTSDDGIQQITVKVYHQGKLVLTTSTYKVSR